MRIRDIQVLTVYMSSLAAFFLVGAVLVWRQPQLDLKNRPLAKWTPTENFATAAIVFQDSEVTLNEALLRPVFRQSRRPFNPLVVTAPTAAPETPPVVNPPQIFDVSQISLKGVLIDSKTKLALIAVPEAPEGQWMPLGAEVKGWKITDIGVDGIVLAIGEQQQKLELYLGHQLD
jgi:hypothetical protein